MQVLPWVIYVGLFNGMQNYESEFMILVKPDVKSPCNLNFKL
jgi:hypothetical protein